MRCRIPLLLAACRAMEQSCLLDATCLRLASKMGFVQLVRGWVCLSPIFCASEPVYIFYPSQPQTCRRRGEVGHARNKCTEVGCLNCEKVGHRIDDCTEPELCKICHDEAHTMVDCPFLLYSANVEPAAPGTVSYAKAAKTTAREDNGNNGAGGTKDLPTRSMPTKAKPPGKQNAEKEDAEKS